MNFSKMFLEVLYRKRTAESKTKKKLCVFKCISCNLQSVYVKEMESHFQHAEATYGDIPSAVNSLTWTLKKLSKLLETKISGYSRMIRQYEQDIETKTNLASGMLLTIQIKYFSKNMKADLAPWKLDNRSKCVSLNTCMEAFISFW